MFACVLGSLAYDPRRFLTRPRGSRAFRVTSCCCPCTRVTASLTNLSFTTSFPFIDFDASVCAGSPKAVAWSQFLTITLLILFVDFYIKVYHQGRDRKLAAEAEADAAKAAGKPPASPKAASNGSSNGAARPTTPAKPHKD